MSRSVLFSRIGALEDIGFDAYTQQITETDSLTGGFEYEFGGDGFFGSREWALRGYYQAGETDVQAIQRGGIRLDRIYLAADVVNTPSGPRCNVSVVSAANGNPIYQDCVPLNLFGRGRASQAAIDWVTGFEPACRCTPTVSSRRPSRFRTTMSRVRTSAASSISSKTSGKSLRTASLPRAGRVRSRRLSAPVFVRNPSRRSSKSARAATSMQIRGIVRSWRARRPTKLSSAFAVCRAARWRPETPSRFSSPTCRSPAASRT